MMYMDTLAYFSIFDHKILYFTSNSPFGSLRSPSGLALGEEKNPEFFFREIEIFFRVFVIPYEGG